jgi:glycosyltransferase involved in cell wall biosynthesis
MYEPWGYTPLESAALGVASITTDISGFGMFLKKMRPQHAFNLQHCRPEEEDGVFVARAMGNKRDYIIDELTDIMYFYTTLNQEERAELKMQARRVATLFDWNRIFVNYIIAHNLALRK